MAVVRLAGCVGAALTLLVGGCGAGSGPLVTTSTGTGRDDPGSTRDVPPVTSEGATGNCIVCDVVYDCPDSTQTSLSLSTSDGTCTTALIDVICSGALFGAASCTGGGGGAFTCGTVTCTPTGG
jgi:hypothetical protein